MELSVPVIVDDVKRSDGLDLTRCIYFQIESEDSLAPWTLGLNGVRLPFLMLGLAGIILAPIGGATEFGSPQEFDDLLSFVENRELRAGEAGLSVEVADLWLPNWILEQRREGIVRGDVLRIGHELFRLAFSFRSGRTGWEEFQRNAHNLTSPVEFSERESRVFRTWAKIEISRASEAAHRDLWLPRKVGGDE